MESEGVFKHYILLFFKKLLKSFPLEYAREILFVGALVIKKYEKKAYLQVYT